VAVEVRRAQRDAVGEGPGAEEVDRGEAHLAVDLAPLARRRSGAVLAVPEEMRKS